MVVHDSALCADAMGEHDSMKRKKGRHTAQGRRPRQQFKSAIQEAIHRQFVATRKVFGSSSLESATVPESQHFIIDMECAALTAIHVGINKQSVAIINGVGNSSLQRGGNT